MVIVILRFTNHVLRVTFQKIFHSINQAEMYHENETNLRFLLRRGIAYGDARTFTRLFETHNALALPRRFARRVERKTNATSRASLRRQELRGQRGSFFFKLFFSINRDTELLR